MTVGSFGPALAARFDGMELVSESHRSTVLRGRDRTDDAPVALKIKRWGGGGRPSEPLGEVSVLLRCDGHPGVPTVREDFVIEGARSYVVVFDWIDGQDLGRALDERAGGLPLEEVAEVLVGTAGVLDHLHRLGPPVIHGDVKPSNVMREPSGRIVLIDFDVASTGSFREATGSEGYLAPEVAAGGSVTPAVDIYGLAATGITLITGVPPNEVGDVEPSPPVNVLRRALSIDPGRRPGSASALAGEFRDVVLSD